MSHVQDYVDALRAGCYFKALELAAFVSQKYQSMKKELIGADELVPLGIYELSQTDINKNDIPAINFIYNYLQYHRYLVNGEKGYTLMTFLSLASLVLAVKEDEELEEVTAATTIDNAEQLKFFLQDNSDFSRLITRKADHSRKWIDIMSQPLAEVDLAKEIETMSNQRFANLEKELGQLGQQLAKEKVHFFCPLIQRRKQAQMVKEALAAFRDHLQDKLEKEGVLFSTDGEMVLLIEPTTKQQKLINRYQIIAVLVEQMKDKTVFSYGDKQVIVKAMEICYYNSPSWQERVFFQKATDVFSGGLKPLYRSLFSQEKLYKQNIEALIALDEEGAGMLTPN
ncbi:Uncharacterised protein [Legionella donaldsonii]|uniref:VPS9 domain-containing protein n=1 Tax=Legionella donaldsonii TaxID=45060 RepID=A0A378IYI5_9GAMM|nr:hypothetical protein [Legionella donaldsonii]STX40534.1 Uncharacterised protein [Legionella donaldsonii]